jgi:transcriptional regulator with XRE-family HTH domain
MVRIRALRDAYALTAEQVADRMAELGIPVNRNTLYNIERGAKKPSDRVLDTYARALGLNPLDVWQGLLRQPAGTDDQATHQSTSPAPQNTRANTPLTAARSTAGRQDGHRGIAAIAESVSWPDSGMTWRGYVERHAISDPGRKRDGTGRVAAEPEEHLNTPDEVADWISRRAAEIDKTAEPNARRLNALKASPWSIHRSVAARGRSVYASSHVAPGHVVDLCAQVVRAKDFGDRGATWPSNGHETRQAAAYSSLAEPAVSVIIE